MALENRPIQLSYADFLRLPPESPGQLIHGELIVVPSPNSNHQLVVGTLFHALHSYLDANPEAGIVFSAPLDVVLRKETPAVVLQPDVLFVSAAREGIIERVVMGPPDLVVEVISPSTARIDAVEKLGLYARYGVSEYWLVWPDDERIDVFTERLGEQFGAPRSLAAEDVLTTSLLPGFELAIARVFAKRGNRPA